MIIRIAQPSDIPVALLILADPDIRRISGYLHQATIFAGVLDDQVIAVAAVTRHGTDMEIMNLAVAPNHQGSGYGRRLLEHIIRHAAENSAQQLSIGTGNSSLPQIAIYQKLGFRFSRIIRNFFAHDHPPIYENGIRCLDMVILTREFPDTDCKNIREKPDA